MLTKRCKSLPNGKGGKFSKWRKLTRLLMSLKIFWRQCKKTDVENHFWKEEWTGNIADDISLRLLHRKRLKKSVQKEGESLFPSCYMCSDSIQNLRVKLSSRKLTLHLNNVAEINAYKRTIYLTAFYPTKGSIKMTFWQFSAVAKICLLKSHFTFWDMTVQFEKLRAI